MLVNCLTGWFSHSCSLIFQFELFYCIKYPGSYSGSICILYCIILPVADTVTKKTCTQTNTHTTPLPFVDIYSFMIFSHIYHVRVLKVNAQSQADRSQVLQGFPRLGPIPFAEINDSCHVQWFCAALLTAEWVHQYCSPYMLYILMTLC